MVSLFIFGLPGLVYAAYVASVFWIGRRRYWPNSSLVWGCAIGLPVIGLTWLAAGIFGLWSPIMEVDAQWKIDRLSRTLYVGEPRATIERRFGNVVPKPDRTGGYGVSESEATPGWDDHLGQYAYASSGGLCFAGFRGIVVFYDIHDRAKFWKPYETGDGC